MAQTARFSDNDSNNDEPDDDINNSNPFNQLRRDIIDSETKKREKLHKNTFHDVAAIVIAEYVRLAGTQADGIRYILTDIYCNNNDGKLFNLKMLKDLNPFLEYKQMYPSSLLLSSYFAYAFKRIDPSKQRALFANIRKSEPRSHCYVARASFQASPVAIAKTIHALINDPSLEPKEFGNTLRSFLHKLPSNMQYLLTNNYQFSRLKYCFIYNIFNHCKNGKKCTRLHK